MALVGDAFIENIDEVWMEDVDGSGFSLTIPAMMISKADSTEVKSHLFSKEKVVM